MKKTLLIFPLALLMACGGESKKTSSFELKGKISNSAGETLFLEKLDSQRPVKVDSIQIGEDGSFSFENYTPQIGFYRIKLTDQNFAVLVLDSADKVNVTADAKDLGTSYKAEGSPETKLFLEYGQMVKENRIRTDSLSQQFQMAMQSVRMDSLKMDSISKVYQGPYENMMDEYAQAISEKIRANSTMFASIMALQPLDPAKYGETYKILDAGLMKKFPNHPNVRMFHDMVIKMAASNPGGAAPDIEMADPSGKNIKLSSLKGKVVLIDFWASWCGPCRKEMPNVVAAYKKFKSKGFEIYGVSLDKDKQAWIDAIKQDGITWPQVSDLQFWENAAAKAYGVQAIPYTVLLDREGKIIAKNLRGPELEKAIEAALTVK